jgi:hypothetical protein
MHSHISIRTLFLWSVLVGICGLVFSQTLWAGPLIALDKASEAGFFEIQCTVMEVPASGDYLVVGERKIVLGDLRRGSQKYRPLLRDASGNATSLDAFKKGQWVFVRGFELPDGSIAVREIYGLPARVANINSPKYPFFKKIPALAPVK